MGTHADEQLDLQSQYDHEQLIVRRRPEAGVTLIVAIHSTALGPGEGGLRMKCYPRIDDAIVDALRLSSAMTFKSAVAGLPFGGGKAVLLQPPDWALRDDVMHTVGEMIDELGGAFIVGPDSGTDTDDMDLILDRTRHVVGFSDLRGGLGDPSPSTAVTVVGAIMRALCAVSGAEAVTGKSVSVLGVGKVGARVAEMLAEGGASVTVCDLNRELAREVADRVGGCTVEPTEYLAQDVDILAPCGAGELISLSDVPRIRARIIAGAANNPLVSEDVAVQLHERQVLYVPDFVANCGGVVHNSVEYLGGTRAEIPQALDSAVKRAGAVLDRAVRAGRSPLATARELAFARIRGKADGPAA
jgi:glutamate dehydrogenase/leucine dehydrogenase